MSRLIWRTREDGVISVWDPQTNVGEHAPVLEPKHWATMDRVIERWGSLAEEVSRVHGVPDGWILAMVKRESNGDPNAVRREPNGWTGIGLLQITHPSLKRGHTDFALMDPKLNLQVGAKYTAALIHKYGKDAPKVFAAFNAGSVRESDENPWGMYQTKGHVTHEVEALNYYLLRSSEKAAERAAALRFGRLELTPDLGKPDPPDPEAA